MEKVWTIIEVLNWTSEYFTKKGIDSPRLNIELMICEVMNISRIDIYTKFDKPITQNELSLLHKMIEQRANHEPLQYILGHTNFYGNKIFVDKSVLIPRPETEELVQKVLEDIDSNKKYNILEIGTGSACIPIALSKKLQNSKIFSVDVSEVALIKAKQNIEYNNCSNISLEKCDILNEIPIGKYDLIVSNPPYIPLDIYNTLSVDVKDFEPEISLTDNSKGLSFYLRFAEIFKKLLADQGKFYLEFGFGQGEAIYNIFATNGYEISIKNDLNNIPRILIGNIKQN